jgi:hypothetical protein
MKITVEYTFNNAESNILKVQNAKYLSDYAIRITFNNGIEKLIDFKPFLNKALHPSIKKYLNENLFSQFSIKDGNLNWNDYDLIFPVGDLYNGTIEG